MIRELLHAAVATLRLPGCFNAQWLRGWENEETFLPMLDFFARLFKRGDCLQHHHVHLSMHFEAIGINMGVAGCFVHLAHRFRFPTRID